MSSHGLFREGSNEIKILDTIRAQIKGKRGFGKPSRKKIICMDINNFELKGSIIKNLPEYDQIEGLVIKIKKG